MVQTAHNGGADTADAMWSLSQATSWRVFLILSIWGAQEYMAEEQWKKPNEAGSSRNGLTNRSDHPQLGLNEG